MDTLCPVFWQPLGVPLSAQTLISPSAPSERSSAQIEIRLFCTLSVIHSFIHLFVGRRLPSTHGHGCSFFLADSLCADETVVGSWRVNRFRLRAVRRSLVQ